jgi:hypothetical protein
MTATTCKYEFQSWQAHSLYGHVIVLSPMGVALLE